MRTLLSSLLRLAIRIFFRRVEIVGAERVPAQGPVVFVLNHPNGLIDPAVLLCLAPRRVSFLAKAPLFRMPLVGLWCRAFDAIPVHRKQDPGAEMTRNRETFDAARGVLVRGGAIALFPEGTSHSDPKLKPLKTGAARIALGAAAALPQDLPLTIVPAGCPAPPRGPGFFLPPPPAPSPRRAASASRPPRGGGGGPRGRSPAAE